MDSLTDDATSSTDERNLGRAAGVLQVVRLLPALTTEQRDSLRALNRSFLSRVATVPASAADDSFNIALAARYAGSDPRPADVSWAQSMVRKAVRELGLEFEVTIPPIPGVDISPDLAFPDQRVAVFVNECLWHGCPHHVVTFGPNGPVWAAGIAETVERDAEVTRHLEDAGWTVVRVWEHDDPRRCAEQIAAAVTAS